jgi:thiamine kinase-like enzyme
VLHPEEIVAYLLEHGLAHPRQIVEGDLRVVEVSQRNSNFLVISRHGPSYVIKQGVGADKASTLANEARVYAALWAEGFGAGIVRYLPRLCRYDPQEHIVILELLPQSEDLLERHSRTRRFSRASAAEVGRALAILHRLDNHKWLEQLPNSIPPARPHWVLSIHRPNPADVRKGSSANIRLIEIIQRFPDLCKLLDDLYAGWQSASQVAPIHCDVRWSNVIVSDHTAGDGKRAAGYQVKLVDWELARLGDPCWDVGVFLGEYLASWLISTPIAGQNAPSPLLALSKYPLERMHPAIRTFWSTYSRKMGFDTATSQAWLLRSVRYAAAWLIQVAYEQSTSATQMSGNTLSLLQLSLNILRRPGEAVSSLLGIPVERSWAA